VSKLQAAGTSARNRYPVAGQSLAGVQLAHWKRRDLIKLVVAAWPVAAPAQQPEMPAIANESSPDPAFAKATAAVNEKLKDSQSARYGGMVRKVGPNVKGKPAEVVCGSVSTRSSSGQYNAKRPFVYFIADGATFLVEANPQPEDVAQIIYGRFCK